MIKRSLLVASLICIFIASTRAIDFAAYCKTTCPLPNDNHTICEYRCELAPDCLDFQNHELSDKERRSVRNVHNHFRNLIASGKDTRGGNGNAKNMMVMNYHKEIEVATACWGKRCSFNHDKCRHTLSFDSAGQNIFTLVSKTPLNVVNQEVFNTSIGEWYSEIEQTTKAMLEKFPEYPVGIGHFTQLVWAKSVYVGCSLVTFSAEEQEYKYRLMVICNYSPAGNFVDEPVYEFGKGCTGKENPNSKYPALCGKLDHEMKSPREQQSVQKQRADEEDDGTPTNILNVALLSLIVIHLFM